MCSRDRGLTQDEFPSLPGQAFAEELDQTLEQEMSRDFSKKQMLDLSREFVKRLHVKNAHRVQIWGKFSRGHYVDALLKGPARFPYLNADSTEGELFKNRDDKEFRVLKDPHMVNMDNTSKEKQEEWDLLQGNAAKIV